MLQDSGYLFLPESESLNSEVQVRVLYVPYAELVTTYIRIRIYHLYMNETVSISHLDLVCKMKKVLELGLREVLVY